MTIIEPECVAAAIGMLHSRHSTFLGWLGDMRFYSVNGKLWSHALDGTVTRGDNPGEARALRSIVRALGDKHEEGR